jgi:two-component system phosphate regulon sensor histidine kinase PhoR
MPGGGPWATRRIRELLPDTRVLALSAFGDREDVIQMIRAGAVGYLLKGSTPARLVDAVQRADQDEAILSPGVTVHVLRELADLLDRAEEVAAELEALGQMKQEMLQTLSHELLTPVTVIRGVVDVMVRGRGELPADRTAELLVSMQRAAARMEQLVRDVSTAALLAGHGSTETQVVRVGRILTTALTELPQTERVRLPPDDEQDLELRAEPDLATRALVAVIDNALSLSPQHEPVEIRATGRAQRVEIRVSDRGPGIALELLDRIFNAFTQVDSSTTRSHPGLGIGLYLARRIMEAHAGTIDVSPRPGGGSAFVLSFPGV